MKLLGNLLMIAIVAMAISCTNDRSSNLGPTPQPINPNTTTANPISPAGGTGGTVVHHYICPNNCANTGGPAAVACPVCGSMYMHNQAYHNQPGMQQNNTQPNTFPRTTPPAPSPAMNSAGVYHYTCPSGHTGGAGSAQPCSVCGVMLVHNQAYHNAPAGAAQPNTTVTNSGQKSPLYINNN